MAQAPKPTSRLSIVLVLLVIPALGWLWYTGAFGGSPVPAPLPTSAPLGFYSLGSSTDGVPVSQMLSVGGTLSTKIEGTSIAITLIDVQQRSLTDFPRERVFETTFVISNTSNAIIQFVPEKVLMAVNDSGFRYSRGSAVTLVKPRNTVIEPESTTKFVLTWRTSTYNTTSGGIAPQTIWMTVNVPISENNTVDAAPDLKVFRFSFS